MMTRWMCIAALVLHLLVMAISVCFASVEIKTILASGWICCGTGLFLAILAGFAKHRPMVFAVARVLIHNHFSWLTVVSVFTFGLTVLGVFAALYSAVRSRFEEAFFAEHCDDFRS